MNVADIIIYINQRHIGCSHDLIDLSSDFLTRFFLLLVNLYFPVCYVPA